MIEKKPRLSLSLCVCVFLCLSLQGKNVCVLMLLCVPLSMMDIPGPCKHAITMDHLLQLKQLVRNQITIKFTESSFDFKCNSVLTIRLFTLQISNQLRTGCSITYTFIERKHLVRGSLKLPLPLL